MGRLEQGVPLMPKAMHLNVEDIVCNLFSLPFCRHFIEKYLSEMQCGLPRLFIAGFSQATKAANETVHSRIEVSWRIVLLIEQ